MPHTLCSNIATHGPFNQHLFLGCSVESFSITVGLNEQQSELSIELVEDCGSVPEGGNHKLYWNSSLAASSTTGPDAGFLYPAVGSPCYFRFGGSEFSGLIQAWTKKNSESGKPKFSVRVVDPRQILEGTQIIIGNYSGGVGSCYNLINVFGFMEQFGTDCVPAPFEPNCSDTFGNALGFGGSNSTDEGMPWNNIKAGLSMLVGGFPSLANIYSPYGRLVFKGSSNSGYGLIPADTLNVDVLNNFGGGFHDGNLCFYSVDLSELPSLPSDYRISGDSIGLMDLINQVCDVASCDYYIELVPVIFLGGIQKVIKVRTISRASQPLLNTLGTYVQDNGVIDSSIGHELRNETTTVFISGAHKESFLEVDYDLFDASPCFPNINPVSETITIIPYMGLNAQGDVITYSTVGAELYKQWSGFDVRALKGTLEGNIGLADSIMIDEREIRAAIAGFDSWVLYARNNQTELYAILDPDNVFDAVPVLGKLAQVMVNKPNAVGPLQMLGNFFGIGNQNPVVQKRTLRNLQKGYKFISTISNSYGVDFMVVVPNSCVTRNADTGVLVYSEAPTDSAWTDLDEILGIERPSDILDQFATEDGKIKALVRLDGAANILDIDIMEPDQFAKIGNDIILPVTVQPNYVFLDKSELCSPRVVFSYASRLKKKDGLIDDKAKDKVFAAQILAVENGLPANEKAILQQNKGVLEKAFRQAGAFGIEHTLHIPDSVIIPMKSNINRYGPWITAGPPGQIKFEINDDLAPWNYGSSEIMCLAGQALADEGVSFQQAIEVGSITVPGFPTYNGGAEFGSPIGGKNLIENREILTTGFEGTPPGASEPTNIDYIYITSDIGGPWNGTYGPIITDITVGVGPSGIQTTYSFRTYTSKIGKMSKFIANRLKSFGLNARKLQIQQKDFLRLRQFGLLGNGPKNGVQKIGNGIGGFFGNAIGNGIKGAVAGLKGLFN